MYPEAFRRFPIWSSVLALSVLVGCGGSEQPVTGSNISPQQDSAVCNEKAWYAGVTDLCAGKLVYRDYVFDDYGADSGQPVEQLNVSNLNTRGGEAGFPTANTPGLLSPAAGDATYPEGAQSTADLVKLTLENQGQMMVATFEMNALYEPGQTIAAIAVDADNDITTTGASLLGLRAEGADVVYEFNAGNVDTNEITGMFPMPDSGQFRVWAVTAQADGTVMNVAFRGPSEQAAATGGLPDQFEAGKGNWWEDLQAQRLGLGDISEFFATVKLDELQTGTTRVQAVKPGFRQRVYTSEYTVPNSTGEGMDLDGVLGREQIENNFCGQTFNAVGKYQSYGLYVPESVDPSQPASLMVLLHGCEANHASQVNQPGMQQQFGEDLQRIIVSPLGRGPTGFYSDLSERDVLDVLEDAKNTFNVDEERVFIGGYSMGGYGAARLAALYPDLFAGVSNWVGFTGRIVNTPIPENPLVALEDQFLAAGGDQIPLNSRAGAFGNVIDFLGNLRHIPGSHTYAGADELVQVNTALAWADRLNQSEDVQYEFYLHPLAEHLTFMALDDWAKEAAVVANLSRVTNPDHITFRTNSAFAFPEYELVHDKAYWVSEVTAREAADSLVDIQSFACNNSEPAFESGQDAGQGPLPYVQTYRRAAGEGMVQTAENRFVATLQNVDTLLIDMAGSCLSGGAAYEVTSDGPVTLRFSNGSSVSLPAGQSSGNL